MLIIVKVVMELYQMSVILAIMDSIIMIHNALKIVQVDFIQIFRKENVYNVTYHARNVTED